MTCISSHVEDTETAYNKSSNKYGSYEEAVLLVIFLWICPWPSALMTGFYPTLS